MNTCACNILLIKARQSQAACTLLAHINEDKVCSKLCEIYRCKYILPVETDLTSLTNSVFWMDAVVKLACHLWQFDGLLARYLSISSTLAHHIVIPPHEAYNRQSMHAGWCKAGSPIFINSCLPDLGVLAMSCISHDCPGTRLVRHGGFQEGVSGPMYTAELT